MDKIPLINPQLVSVVTSPTGRSAAPILQAKVVSSEPLKHSSDSQAAPHDNRFNDKSRSTTDEQSAADQQRYKVVLKIGKQQLETISAENFKKGSQLDIKVMPGPELKIITKPNSQLLEQIPVKPTASVPAQAALQQLLADRMPNIQSPSLTTLIGQLSQLISVTKSTATTDTLNSPITSKDENPLATSKANTYAQTPKNALANLTYQSLANQSSMKSQAASSMTTHVTNNLNHKPEQASAPLLHAKDWLQQLPTPKDISNSAGLKNALNNTGIRAESQFSQLAQQFVILNKEALKDQRSGDEKSANTIFQQLQRIQQKLFSSPSESSPKTDLASIVRNTALSLEKSSETILTNLKTHSSHAKANTPPPPLNANPAIPTHTTSVFPTPLNTNSPVLTASNWQNPLLSNPAYTTLSELLKDPLLQNPSSDNKFALNQILKRSTQQANTPVRIPLNWPERNGSDALFLRTLQNLLGHIEREQSIQLQQSDTNTSNTPNPASLQNQQWLPLLIHHQQQLQLIEFFINKEEKKNTQGEKKTHWFINLHFDLPQLGELGIEISMFENECNTTFWSESPSTLSQLNRHVQPLRERLAEQGIIVSDIQSRHGTLNKRKHNFEQRLIDIKT